MLQNIKAKLEQALPGSTVSVVDTSAGHKDHNPGAHIGVCVIWNGFAGMSLVAQHQMIYKALSQELKETVHALQIATRVN